MTKPVDDEPKYLTVCHPYPGAPNMELLGHRKTFVFWLACCTGKDPLISFFHKPKSDKIIIEVSRTFKGWRQLLGEHKWSEFLKNPDDDEKNTVSRIFYCLYSHAEEVKKAGWKQVYVEDVWFNEWSPINAIIRDPYPLTRFCEVPVEDKTNYPLCRVLPVEHFPRLRVATPETRARSSPVGSDAWVAAKSGLLASSAWAKGPPKSKAKIVGPSISPALGVGSASAAVSPRLDTNRGRGPQFLQVPNIYAPTPELAAPPGLSRLHTNLSATSLSIPGWEIPPILSRGPSAVGSSGSSGVDSIRATPIAQESPDVQIAGEGLEETMPGLSLYDEREDDLWTMGVPVGVSIEPAADQMLPNLWEDYGKKKPEISKEDIVCQVHGKICAKGICKQRKAQEVEKRQREAERAQRNKVVKPSGWRTASNKGARGKEAEFQTRQSPPHVEDSALSSAGEDLPPVNSTNVLVRSRPPHLQVGKSSLAQPGTPGEPAIQDARPARGRKMNTSTSSHVPLSSPANVSEAPLVIASSDDGWTTVGVGRAATVKNNNTRSVATSSNGDWGPPVDLWGAPSVRRAPGPRVIPSEGIETVKRGSSSGVKKSWADEMQDNDARSVVESVNGGWGTTSQSPWS